MPGCDFIALKSQEKCSEKAEVSYGKVGFCKKHWHSLQAKKAKVAVEKLKAEEETKKEIKKEILLPRNESTVPKTVTKVTQRRISKNEWGNYEDKETKIVFDSRTGKAIGIQLLNGKVIPLDQRRIEICKSKGWKYEEEESDDESEEESEEEESEEEEDEESEEEDEESEEEDEEDSEESEEDDGWAKSKDEESENDEDEDEESENDEDEDEEEDDGWAKSKDEDEESENDEEDDEEGSEEEDEWESSGNDEEGSEEWS